ncbi:MAG: ABC transporter ATP-binding protein [Bacteroidota bacterium]|nr:ABC transporter ATP-binding protein [Bacteroidota bacterium]
MITLQNINKTFRKGKNRVEALSDINIKISENSFTLIKGHSGCGKSTLLFTMGGLLQPDSGSVNLLNHDLYKLNESNRRRLSARNIGFVFQAYHLLPYLSARNNMLLQNQLSYIEVDLKYVDQLITELKLQNRLEHKPNELSAGERQRVALVRALASNPGIILADEPTGNLDPENSEIVLSFFNKFQRDGGTVIMVSHSSEADKLADRTIHIKDGRILAI